jgi:hypothetical protein
MTQGASRVGRVLPMMICNFDETRRSIEMTAGIFPPRVQEEAGTGCKVTPVSASPRA